MNSRTPVLHPQHVIGQVFVCAAHGLVSLVLCLDVLCLILTFASPAGLVGYQRGASVGS